MQGKNLKSSTANEQLIKLESLLNFFSTQNKSNENHPILKSWFRPCPGSKAHTVDRETIQHSIPSNISTMYCKQCTHLYNSPTNCYMVCERPQVRSASKLTIVQSCMTKPHCYIQSFIHKYKH